MNQANQPTKTVEIKRLKTRLRTLAVLCIILCIALPVLLYLGKKDKQVEAKVEPGVTISEDYQIPEYSDDMEGQLAEYGYRLLTETYALLGPESEMPFTGNHLACTSCHLNGGTKPFAAPYIGLSAVFPIYVGRSNAITSLEERINGCFERSMNGRMLPVDSKEMRAMVSYIKHLSKNAPVGQRLTGQGFLDIQIPDRKANLKHGELVFQKQCVSCHGADGQGLKGNESNRKGGYIYPPLWGDDSYNDGAGMARLLTAAKFIKGNMPYGIRADQPALSDEEAYDVAAYVNSHERPSKAHKERDYPDLSKKPKDSAYGPYADDIPQEQHKYGPFNF